MRTESNRPSEFFAIPLYPRSATRPRNLQIPPYATVQEGFGSPAKWEKVGNSSWVPQTILEAPGLGARARKMWTGARQLFGGLPRKGGQDFLAWSSGRGANEFEGQFRGWGLTGRFPWRLGRGGGMHPSNCGETTGLSGPPGGGGGGVGEGSQAGRGRGGHVRPRGEGPSRPGSNRSPAKWLR